MVLGAVLSRGSLGLWVIGAPGYRAYSSVAMAPMFKGIRWAIRKVLYSEGEATHLYGQLPFKNNSYNMKKP